MSLKNLRNKVQHRSARSKPISRMWKPGETSTRIRLIPGKYRHPDGEVEPIGFYVSHYIANSKKFLNCSALWVPSETSDLWVTEGKCVACHAKSTRQRKDIGVSRKYPATIVVCENFHLDPYGYDGKLLPVDSDGKQIRRKVQCTGKTCKGCQEKLDVEWGRTMIWEIPETFLDQLMQTQEELSRCCLNCGAAPDPDTGEGGLSAGLFMCKHCGYDLQDLVNKDEVHNFYADDVANLPPIECPRCGEVDTPGTLPECSGCDMPKAPTLFDIDFTVKRDATGMSLLVTKAVPKAPDPRITAKMAEPLDLDAYYRPTPLSVQAAILEVENPWAKPEESAPFKDYNKR